MRALLFALAALVLVGCGKDTTVTVGDGSHKGIVKTEIDRAKDVGSEGSSRAYTGTEDK